MTSVYYKIYSYKNKKLIARTVSSFFLFPPLCRKYKYTEIYYYPQKSHFEACSKSNIFFLIYCTNLLFYILHYRVFLWQSYIKVESIFRIHNGPTLHTWSVPAFQSWNRGCFQSEIVRQEEPVRKLQEPGTCRTVGRSMAPSVYGKKKPREGACVCSVLFWSTWHIPQHAVPE